MFDLPFGHLMLVAVVALVVIGPKDLPKAMRVAGYWVGKARGVARQFRSGFDDMVREAEVAEMEKRWASENERIMREHPHTLETDTDDSDAVPMARTVTSPVEAGVPIDHPSVMTPVIVEKPEVVAARTHAPPPAPHAADEAAS